MNKQTIFIVSWYGMSEAGGLERVTYYMAKAWENRYNVEIIDFHKMCEKGFYKVLLRKHYVLDSILVSIYVNRVIHKSKKRDKVITQGFNAPFVHADINIEHGTMRGLKIAEEGPDAKWHFNQLFEKISADKADRVVVVATSVKDELLRFYGTEERKIQIIENCVDTKIFFPKETDRNDNNINVLFAGRLEVRKGLNKLIEFADYIEKKDNMRLFIATNNNENTELFSQFTHTQIHCALNTEEMNEFYNSGDVMFFPSLYEGFGLVPIEALSAGIPVMGNEVGVVNNLYICGQAGIGIISGNMDEDVTQIFKLAAEYKDLKAREKLHQSMVANYSLEAYREKLEKLWD